MGINLKEHFLEIEKFEKELEIAKNNIEKYKKFILWSISIENDYVADYFKISYIDSEGGKGINGGELIVSFVCDFDKISKDMNIGDDDIMWDQEDFYIQFQDKLISYLFTTDYHPESYEFEDDIMRVEIKI
jgi:hypothetical protein